MYGIVDTVLDSLTFYMSKLSDNRTMPDPSHLLALSVWERTLAPLLLLSEQLIKRRARNASPYNKLFPYVYEMHFLSSCPY